MALNKEDKADVKGAMGKAIANKVSKVTNDSHNPFHPRKGKSYRPMNGVGYQKDAFEREAKEKAGTPAHLDALKKKHGSNPEGEARYKKWFKMG